VSGMRRAPQLILLLLVACALVLPAAAFAAKPPARSHSNAVHNRSHALTKVHPVKRARARLVAKRPQQALAPSKARPRARSPIVQIARSKAPTVVKTMHHAAQVRRAARLPLVMIDPGHGGTDPGAIGTTGSLEKTLTLKTALTLRQQLLATRRYRVELTRSNDMFVSLFARVQLARSRHADLFVSIHADSSSDSSARGASVYTRSRASGLETVSRHSADGQSSKSIGHALSGAQHLSMQGSTFLQYVMIGQLGTRIGMVDEPARQSQFYVLGATGIAGVLLEMGYISNPLDEALLRRNSYRAMIARSVEQAIDDYFEEVGGGSRTPT
jgi:N-acetylmuramoyl-L-alanine amidase